MTYKTGIRPIGNIEHVPADDAPAQHAADAGKQVQHCHATLITRAIEAFGPWPQLEPAAK